MDLAKKVATSEFFCARGLTVAVARLESKTTTCLDLYFLGEHNESSHAEDKSIHLKHKQIVAVHEGARVCPQQSAAVLRRNLAATAENSPEKQIDPKFLNSVRHRVKAVRKQLTVQKLQGFHIDDSYGSHFLQALFYQGVCVLSLHPRRRCIR